MSPAEFKSLRESMGLSTKWLSLRWDCNEYSVQRWEKNRILPDRLADDMRSIKATFDSSVRQVVESDATTVNVPRVDAPTLEYPAAWYRAIAQRASEQCGVRIGFAGDGER